MNLKTSTAVSSGSKRFVVVRLSLRDEDIFSLLLGVGMVLFAGRTTQSMLDMGLEGPMASLASLRIVPFVGLAIAAGWWLTQRSEVLHEGGKLVFITKRSRKLRLAVEDIDRIDVDVTEKTVRHRAGTRQVTVRQLQVHTVDGDVFDVLRPFKSEREERDVVAKVNAHLDAFRRR